MQGCGPRPRDVIKTITQPLHPGHFSGSPQVLSASFTVPLLALVKVSERLDRMIFLRSSLTRHAETTKLVNRSFIKSARTKRPPPPPPPFPVIPTCPSPTCQCSSTPPDLDIDRTRDLNGSMSPYAQHLLVSTGRKDWTSKIENERDTAPWGRFISDMKAALGRGSEFHDVCLLEGRPLNPLKAAVPRDALTYTKPAPE